MQISVNELEVGVGIISTWLLIQAFCGNNLEDERRQSLTDFIKKQVLLAKWAEELRGFLKYFKAVFFPTTSLRFSNEVLLVPLQQDDDIDRRLFLHESFHESLLVV